jgi:hypothetical protein
MTQPHSLSTACMRFCTRRGFEVWMSHAGTVTVFPNGTALDNCLQAVDDCDLFLAVITPRYGSGVLTGQLGITHQQLLKAIQLEKPRWILAYDHVVFARTLFDKLGCRSEKDRNAMLAKIGFDDERKLKTLHKKHELVIDDFRVIDMHDAAARHNIQVPRQMVARTGLLLVFGVLTGTHPTQPSACCDTTTTDSLRN